MTQAKGACPVCNGTGRNHDHSLELSDYAKSRGWYGYRSEDDCIACDNCGAQYMFGQATGQVNLRPDGTPCVHEYKGESVGRCLTKYTCVHCDDTYHIDSGD